MNKSFTPGPWKWTGTGQYSNLKPVNPDPDNQAVSIIMEVGQWSGTGFFETKLYDSQAEHAKNMQLIETAPELYTALANLVKQVNDHCVKGDCIDIDEAMTVLHKASPRWPL